MGHSKRRNLKLKGQQSKPFNYDHKKRGATQYHRGASFVLWRRCYLVNEVKTLDLKTKRFIDLFIGVPVLFLLSLVMRAAKSKSTLRSNFVPETILISKFQGIGSLMIAIPAIAGVRREFPRMKIVFWGTRSTADFASSLSFFDQIVCLDDRNIFTLLKSVVGNLIELRKLKLDVTFDLEVYSKISSILLFFSRAKQLIGFAVDTVSSRQGLYSDLVYFNRYQYLGKAYSYLFGLLDPRKIFFDTEAPIYQPSAGVKKSGYIVINPNCGPLSYERLWPVGSMRELVLSIQQKWPAIEIFLVGAGEEEIERGRQIAEGTKAKNLTSQLNFSELWNLMNSANLVVSGDSAPLHFALLSKAKVIGLFGPTKPETYFPVDLRTNCKAIYLNYYCSPCVHHWEPPPCRGLAPCMKRILPESVIEEIKSMLLETSETFWKLENREKLEAYRDQKYYPGLIP